MIDPQIIAFLVIAAGGILGVIVPALFAMHDKGEKFELSYLYGLCIPLAAGAFAALPEGEIELTFRSLFLLFFAGVGIQGLVNKGNTERIKRKKKN